MPTTMPTMISADSEAEAPMSTDGEVGREEGRDVREDTCFGVGKGDVSGVVDCTLYN